MALPYRGVIHLSRLGRDECRDPRTPPGGVARVGIGQNLRHRAGEPRAEAHRGLGIAVCVPDVLEMQPRQRPLRIRLGVPRLVRDGGIERAAGVMVPARAQVQDPDGDERRRVPAVVRQGEVELLDRRIRRAHLEQRLAKEAMRIAIPR